MSEGKWPLEAAFVPELSVDRQWPKAIECGAEEMGPGAEEVKSKLPHRVGSPNW